MGVFLEFGGANFANLDVPTRKKQPLLKLSSSKHTSDDIWKRLHHQRQGAKITKRSARTPGCGAETVRALESTSNSKILYQILWTFSCYHPDFLVSGKAVNSDIVLDHSVVFVLFVSVCFLSCFFSSVFPHSVLVWMTVFAEKFSITHQQCPGARRASR